MNSIESILERNLGPVEAPAELWTRVRDGGATKPRRDYRGLVWATAAVAIVVAAWSVNRPDAIRSSEPAAIRAWAKTRAGVEIPLVGGEVTGAQARRGTVRVAYRVNGHEATLSVEKTGRTGDPVHWIRAANQGKSSVSWTLGGQVYTLACAFPGELEEGCRLCHAEVALN